MDSDENESGSVLVEEPSGAGTAGDTRLPDGIYNNFTFEFANAVMWQSFGSPVILFIRQAGASTFIVGALSAFQLLLMPVTMAFSGLVERFGYRRTALVCWTLRWIVCSTLILVALFDFPGFGQWRVPLVVLVLFMFHLLRNFGVSANIAWLTAIIPPSRRGLYLSRTQKSEARVAPATPAVEKKRIRPGEIPTFSRM